MRDSWHWGMETLRLQKLHDIVKWAEHILEASHIESARLNAEMLLSHILRIHRSELYFKERHCLSKGQCVVFDQLLRRRIKREPVQYILTAQSFMGLEMQVEPGVLIPRFETELLVELLCEHVTKQHQAPSITIVDVGTGSGNIAIALVYLLTSIRQKHVFAIDISQKALDIARKNVARFAFQKEISLCHGHLFEPLVHRNMEGKVDVIVSNPPYIASDVIPTLAPEVRDFEPLESLDGGDCGLKYYPLIIEEARRYLRPGGLLALEMGIGQDKAILNMIDVTKAFDNIQVIADYSQIPRIIFAQRLVMDG